MFGATFERELEGDAARSAKVTLRTGSKHLLHGTTKWIEG
jgi:hypothetical protein